MRMYRFNRKHILAAILTLAVLLTVIPVAGLYAYAAPARVTDEVGLLSDDELATLNELADGVSEAHDFDVVVHIADGVDGDIMDYADDYYDYNGYRDDGCVLVIDMAEREYWISTKGYGITALTDYGIERIGDDVTSYMGDGEYYGAVECFIEDVDSYVTSAEEGDVVDVGNASKEPFNWPFRLIISLVMGFVVAFIIVQAMKSQLKSVRAQNSAVNYVVDGSLNVTDDRELYLYSTVTRTEIPRESSSGGSSTHTSSSGSSHGGGGGHF